MDDCRHYLRIIKDNVAELSRPDHISILGTDQIILGRIIEAAGHIVTTTQRINDLNSTDKKVEIRDFALLIASSANQTIHDVVNSSDGVCPESIKTLDIALKSAYDALSEDFKAKTGEIPQDFQH